MTFGEKIKAQRTLRGMDQAEFAVLIGVSRRTLINYEIYGRHPRTRDDYKRIANTLGVDVNYLLTEEEDFVLSAGEQYGSRGRKSAQELVQEVSGLFAGGELADEDLDEMMKGIQQAYWIAKEKNKKYTPKKYRSDNKTDN